MSDTKLDPASLTAEERAIVEDAVSHHAFFDADGNIVECDEWTWCYRSAIARILARRALFAPEKKETAKVECPNCGEKVPTRTYHIARNVAGGIPSGEWEGNNYTCQPSPPAEMPCPECGQPTTGNVFMSDHLCRPPAPPSEMPEADLTFHINRLESMMSRNVILGDVKESVFALIVHCRSQPVTFAYDVTPGGSVRVVAGDGSKWQCSQPEPAAPVEMPEAITTAISYLRGYELDGLRRGEVAAALETFWRTHAQPRPKLEKTRRALKCGQERLNIVFLSEETTTRWNNLFYEALAELDAAEGVEK